MVRRLIIPIILIASICFIGAGRVLAANEELTSLELAFSGFGVITPASDAADVPTNHVVLTQGRTGPVVLADNLGVVLLDLNGFSIKGVDGTDGVAGGAAIVIEGSAGECEHATELVVMNHGTAPVDAAVIRGGDGYTGLTPTAGGAAIYIVSDSRDGVKVSVRGRNSAFLNRPMVCGGNGGGGVGDGVVGGAAGASLAKAEGLTGIYSITGDYLEKNVKEGSAGATISTWGWCICAKTPTTIPEGVTYDESSGRYLFWRYDKAGAATFDFNEIAGWALQEKTFHFENRTIDIAGFVTGDGVKNPSEKLTLTKFVGEPDTCLNMVCDGSAFTAKLKRAQQRIWEGLSFTRADGVIARALSIEGGYFAVSNCTFVGGVAEQDGGAISAHRLASSSSVKDSSFAGNSVLDGYGKGGAIYASADGIDVRLSVEDCAFEENEAFDGGAINTQVIYSYSDSLDECPIQLGIARCRFIDNAASGNGDGGAIAAEGHVTVADGADVAEGQRTLFEGNFAGGSGGALSIGGVADDHDPEYPMFPAAKIEIGRGVRFVDNVVSNDYGYASGGAIGFDLPECWLTLTGVEFKGNRAVGSCDYEVAGGAVSMLGGLAEVDTCVFDDNDAVAEEGFAGGFWCYGGAIATLETVTALKNSTFRGSNIEAVNVSGAEVSVTNCVAVGNGTAEGTSVTFADLELDADVTMAYSAYGTELHNETKAFETYRNLTNRTEAIYAGETLKLNPEGFNPVAALGLEQTAKDFLLVDYGSCPVGYSMGAYETPALQVSVTVEAKKPYDGTTSSNGCEWVWSLTDTNGNAVAYDDLVPTNLDAAAASAYLAELYMVTNWVFGTEANGGAVGLYDSTNEAGSARWIAGGISLVDDTKAWYASVLDVRLKGEIKESWFVLPVDCGDGETNDVYFTWSWLDTAIGRGPTNDYAETCGILREAETNGYSRWQNYVMGIDGSNPTNRIATIYEKMDPTDIMITNTTIRVVTPIEAFDPPSHGTGLKPEYRLYNMTLLPRGVLPADKWLLGTADEPRFPLDLPTLTYGLMTQTWEYGQTHLEIFAVFVGGEPPCDPYRLVTNDFGVKVLTGE